MFWVFYLMLKGLHIFLGITWVGGVMFVGWGVYPAVKKFKPTEQRKILSSLIKWTHWLFILAGAGVITTGVLLGTVGGMIRSWQDIWLTSYGNIWLTALLIGLFTLAWGVFVGYRKAMKVISNESLWKLAETDETKPLNKALLGVAVLESVELLGFVALIISMLLI